MNEDINISPPSKSNEFTKYSTEETIIGEWIDGKPIYRRVIETNTGSSETWTQIASVPYVDYMLRIDGGYIFDGELSCHSLIFTNSGDGKSSQVMFSHTNGGCILHRTSFGSLKGKPVKLIIEYTKKDNT